MIGRPIDVRCELSVLIGDVRCAWTDQSLNKSNQRLLLLHLLNNCLMYYEWMYVRV